MDLNEEDKHAARLAYTGVALHALITRDVTGTSSALTLAAAAVQIADAVVKHLQVPPA